MKDLIDVLTVLNEQPLRTKSDLCHLNRFLYENKIPYCLTISCGNCLFGSARRNLNKSLKLSTKLGI